MIDSIRVTYDLSKLHCIEESDGRGNAEPYMWTVFFKVDGDTVKLNDELQLEGTATVVATPGNHGDLPVGDDGIDADQDVSIPSSLGRFTTRLRPIRGPLGISAGGVVGCLVILMEEDETPDDAIENGHKALNKALQKELDDLIPTLGIDKEAPTEADIDAIEKAITKAVEDTVADGVDFWDVLGGLFGNGQDDMIGTERFIFSHDDLDAKAGSSFGITKTWIGDGGEGDWRLHGTVRVDKTLVAGVLRSGDWGHRWLFDRTTEQFVAQTQKLFDDEGLRLSHLETYKDHAGVRRWASIHRAGNWANRLELGLTTAQFVQKVATHSRDGLALERMVNWTDDGQLRWAGCWRSGLAKTRFEHGHDTGAFVQVTQDLFDDQGLRLTQAVGYQDGGQLRWAGIYLLGNWAHRFYIRDDQSSFVQTVQDLFDDHGLRLVDVETWVDGGKRRYAGISRSGNWANRLLVRRGLETFIAQATKAFEDDGLRLVDIDVYEA